MDDINLSNGEVEVTDYVNNKRVTADKYGQVIKEESIDAEINNGYASKINKLEDERMVDKENNENLGNEDTKGVEESIESTQEGDNSIRIEVTAEAGYMEGDEGPEEVRNNKDIADGEETVAEDEEIKPKKKNWIGVTTAVVILIALIVGFMPLIRSVVGELAEKGGYVAVDKERSGVIESSKVEGTSDETEEDPTGLGTQVGETAFENEMAQATFAKYDEIGIVTSDGKTYHISELLDGLGNRTRTVAVYHETQDYGWYVEDLSKVMGVGTITADLSTRLRGNSEIGVYDGKVIFVNAENRIAVADVKAGEFKVVDDVEVPEKEEVILFSKDGYFTKTDTALKLYGYSGALKWEMPVNDSTVRVDGLSMTIKTRTGADVDSVKAYRESIKSIISKEDAERYMAEEIEMCRFTEYETKVVEETLGSVPEYGSDNYDFFFINLDKDASNVKYVVGNRGMYDELYPAGYLIDAALFTYKDMPLVYEDGNTHTLGREETVCYYRNSNKEFVRGSFASVTGINMDGYYGQIIDIKTVQGKTYIALALKMREDELAKHGYAEGQTVKIEKVYMVEKGDKEKIAYEKVSVARGEMVGGYKYIRGLYLENKLLFPELKFMFETKDGKTETGIISVDGSLIPRAE